MVAPIRNDNGAPNAKSDWPYATEESADRNIISTSRRPF